MRLLLPLLVFAACSGHLATAVAATSADADPHQLELPAGITATMKSRANVRFGPSLNARVVRAMDAGEAVEIVGSAQVPDWLVIRFPLQGTAWVHGKVMQAIDGGKRWKVTTEGAKARDDARLQGNIVAELAAGEILEDRNRTVGDWHAVYVPSAVAYVHRSVLNLPDGQAVQQQKAKAKIAQQTWGEAQTTYARYFAAVQHDANAAATLDWSGLTQQLQSVAKDHPEASVRQWAQRIRDGIERVLEATQAVHDAHGQKPTTPTTPVTPTKPTTPTTPTTPTKPNTPTPTTPDNSLQVPAHDDPVALTPTEVAKPDAPTAPHAFIAEGCVSENSDYPKVGAPNLLIDGNSNVVAFLSMKPGSTLNLSEYYWRWVGVSGESKEIDPALHGLGRKIPLIVVDDVGLLKK